MNNQQLFEQIIRKRSYLCVGLDTDLKKLPAHLGDNVEAILRFNQAIIEATSPFAVAYKINTAFYEQYGTAGWEIMEETLKCIPADCYTIADAKRGDIGNTGKMYARAFLENLNFDSITVNPYMGKDSVEPFLKTGKTAIILALTSNPGSQDFQYLKVGNSYLFEKVLETATTWGSVDQMMFVVGATQTDMLNRIRTLIPDHFLLVPGVGAQGGSLQDVSEQGMNSRCGLLVNSSRGIIYASSDEDFAIRAGEEAKKLQEDMEILLTNHGLIPGTS
ncbi:MAG: orotidine-5'-phosphate decarboxylase [Bacteroidetes bacterium]|nr:orotidine-5'-phosphate decarboxylase [Bacteroidota bacterium]